MTRSGSGANYPQQYSQGLGGAGHEPANLGDILERVLDKGIVIAGDIRVNLLDIELLTIKLRLVIASLETAREVGIDWWEHDPWLSGNNRDLELENERLRARIEVLESGERRVADVTDPHRAVQPAESPAAEVRDDDS
ncbi:gas vesicle protein [Prescottella equi]|uniref:gas vesicle protein n=1 Tax=Rhodococcus hoagii TaxID=43767 RepID=UPI000D1069FE|nr:gas vesicle protein [Prescottella equi]AVP68909.1 gas vesicle protein [Prescottella equi]MBM4731704.1 gas vesicle protein [Prescottella equi]